MKQVDFRVKSTEDHAQVDVHVVVEKWAVDKWVFVKEIKYWTGTAQAAGRSLVLEDDERLVISGNSDIELVYDRRQNAVVAQKRGELTAAENVRREDELKRRQNSAEEAEYRAAFELRNSRFFGEEIKS